MDSIILAPQFRREARKQQSLATTCGKCDVVLLLKTLQRVHRQRNITVRVYWTDLVMTEPSPFPPYAMPSWLLRPVRRTLCSRQLTLFVRKLSMYSVFLKSNLVGVVVTVCNSTTSFSKHCTIPVPQSFHGMELVPVLTTDERFELTGTTECRFYSLYENNDANRFMSVEYDQRISYPNTNNLQTT